MHKKTDNNLKSMTDWKYEHRMNNGKITFTIIPSIKIRIPNTLFKYYSINKKSISALTKNYVYASKPEQLNDIFDCDERLIDTKDDDFLTKFYEGLPSTKDNKSSESQVAASFLKTFFYDRIGILSLTESPSNYLMWAYYTNHKGFAVEFDYNEFEFVHHGPFPINYCENISKIKLTKDTVANAFLYQTNIKTSAWKHEKEWRILIECPENHLFNGESIKVLSHHKLHNQKFHYNKNAIKSVYLGFNFFNRGLHGLEPEVKQLSNKELLVELKENKRLKMSLLNYLAKNKTTTYITGMVKDRFDLTFTESKVEKLSQFEYKIYAC